MRARACVGVAEAMAVAINPLHNTKRIALLFDGAAMCMHEIVILLQRTPLSDYR